MTSILTNRYGISALSKKFKNRAVANEIMIDKQTGEVQVKSKDGTIVSYNYISRLNAHIDTLTFNSYNADLYGKIYELDIENLDLPCVVQKDVNLLDGTLLISDATFKSFMLSIDMDALNPLTTISKLDIGEIPIEVEIEYTNGSTKSVVKIVEPIYRINRMKIYRKDLHVNATRPTLKSLKIGANELFEGHERFILHSILLNVEE